MKYLRGLFTGMMLVSALACQGAETAQATAFCQSLRFQRGIDPNGNYYLELTSVPGSVNGELAPDFFASGYTHSTYLSLEDELLGETLSGQMAIDVPRGGDANGDGFWDFFQVSQGVTNLTSSGAYNLSFYGNGTVTAVWNRDAGSKDGGCRLSMNLMMIGTVNFSFSFEVLEYVGPLSYTPGTTNVEGNLKLIQTGNPGNFMSGAVLFVKSPSDPFNELSLQVGNWTNESQLTISYIEDVFTRDARWPTNYYGFLDFSDTNNPSSFYPFGSWILSIDDLNDTNRNGIPDFSDDPSSKPPPRRPVLALMQTSTNWLVTVHGDIGYVYDVQELSALGTSSWQTKASITLTNDPQSVTLPLPNTNATFWRVMAH